MEDTDKIFQEKALELTREFIHRELNLSDGADNIELRKLVSPNSVIIGPNQSFFHNDIPGAKERGDPDHYRDSIEMLDEWYEVQPLSKEICCVYGTLWWVEKRKGVPLPLTPDIKTRFTVIYKNTEDGIQVVNVHHSVASPVTNMANLVWEQEEMADAATKEELVLHANTDALTGLYNRMGLISEINRRLNSDKREMAALFMMDIDSFKSINDTMGHRAGDAVLAEIASRINRIFRANDIKGRLGGDEFMIYMENIKTHQVGLQRAEMICQLIHQPIFVENQKVETSCSIGVVFVSGIKETFDDIYEKADAAMYRAKALGKNRYAVYESNMPNAPYNMRSAPQNKGKRLIQISRSLISRGKERVKGYIQRYYPKRHIPVAWVAAVCMIVFLSIFCVKYLEFMKDTIRADSKSSLGELGKHISMNLLNGIQNTNAVMSDLNSMFPWMKFDTEETAMNFLKEQSDHWGFSDFSLIDSEGLWHHIDGTKDMPKEFMTQVMNHVESADIELQMFQKEDKIIFVSSLVPVTIGGTKYIASAGIYAASEWSNLVKLDIYNKEAKACIVTDTGEMIISTPEETKRNKADFFSGLEEAEFEKEVSLESVHRYMKRGEDIEALYHLNGMEYYMSCTPIGFHDWYLIFTVPSSTINYAGNTMVMSTITICIVLIFVFILISLIFHFMRSHTRQMLWKTAYIDEVTGGANKNKFELDVKDLLCDFGGNYMLVYTNICQFKLLNDRFGKEEADQVLAVIYNDILKNLRPKECCGHLSADNFGLLLLDNQSETVQERLSQFAARYSLLKNKSGTPYGIRMIFGIYPITDRNESLTQMIDRANLAMREVPDLGDCPWVIYQDVILEKFSREKILKERLEKAIKNREFCVYLQPKVSLTDRKIVGAEALVRWNSPQDGLISPGEFIPLAERTGMVRKIDLFVFEEVCKVLSKWQEKGKRLPILSFNLSKVQLENVDFLSEYRDILSGYQIPAGCLDFEFTESILYDNMDVLKRAVSEIHEMGCLCSIDDFGFGYSSLGLLGQFEADTLKLDRSFFVEDSNPENRSNRIIKSTILLARDLGIYTVAEGVQDEAHVEMLRQFGCDSIQGYIFSKPLRVDQFEEYMEQ